MKLVTPVVLFESAQGRRERRGIGGVEGVNKRTAKPRQLLADRGYIGANNRYAASQRLANRKAACSLCQSRGNERPRTRKQLPIGGVGDITQRNQILTDFEAETLG